MHCDFEKGSHWKQHFQITLLVGREGVTKKNSTLCTILIMLKRIRYIYFFNAYLHSTTLWSEFQEYALDIKIDIIFIIIAKTNLDLMNEEVQLPQRVPQFQVHRLEAIQRKRRRRWWRPQVDTTGTVRGRAASRCHRWNAFTGDAARDAGPATVWLDATHHRVGSDNGLCNISRCVLTSNLSHAILEERQYWRKEHVYLTIQQYTIPIYNNRIVRRMSLRLNKAASATAKNSGRRHDVRIPWFTLVSVIFAIFVGGHSRIF